MSGRTYAGHIRRVKAKTYTIRRLVGLRAKEAVVTYANYAYMADCADAMADAWEDSAGCAQAIYLHENLLKLWYIVKWGLHGIVHI